nr:isoform 2 of solute carrier family 25 member 45 [Quercus suber]
MAWADVARCIGALNEHRVAETTVFRVLYDTPPRTSVRKCVSHCSCGTTVFRRPRRLRAISEVDFCYSDKIRSRTCPDQSHFPAEFHRQPIQLCRAHYTNLSASRLDAERITVDKRRNSQRSRCARSRQRHQVPVCTYRLRWLPLLIARLVMATKFVRLQSFARSYRRRFSCRPRNARPGCLRLQHDKRMASPSRLSDPAMSATVKGHASLPPPPPPPQSTQGGSVVTETVASNKKGKTYTGFVAGVFSGVAKLSVGHPFDTIKVRLQTAPKSHFSGPLDCVLQTVRKEGIVGLYKGATRKLLPFLLQLGQPSTQR